MNQDINTNVHAVKNADLEQEANAIRREFDAANAAGRSRLDHAIAAGHHLLKVKAQIKRGFRGWLEDHCFNKSDSYDFMLLARSEESVRRAGHCSIRAALQMLRANSGKSKSRLKSKLTGVPLTKAAWTKATIDERRRFLDAIGVDAVCEAMSFAFRAQLNRRLIGVQAKKTSGLSETIAAAIRQALSLQKTTEPGETPAMGVTSALNSINNKLVGAGFDLNNITSVVIDAAAIQRKAAA